MKKDKILKSNAYKHIFKNLKKVFQFIVYVQHSQEKERKIILNDSPLVLLIIKDPADKKNIDKLISLS